MTEFALIVDDNTDYVRLIRAHLKPFGYHFDRVWNAAEGFELFEDVGVGYYSLIVTDITMEGQTAGLWLIRKIRRYGYRNPIMVASTGFNNPLVLWGAKAVMRWWGVDLLVPKKALQQGRFKVIPISRTGKKFIENHVQNTANRESDP
jgi:CheY-like chemotaxis protein